MEKLTMEKLTNYCKQYGFIFQGSEIYGGLANSWDFGPLGAELKKNIKNDKIRYGINDTNIYIRSKVGGTCLSIGNAELKLNNVLIKSEISIAFNAIAISGSSDVEISGNSIIDLSSIKDKTIYGIKTNNNSDNGSVITINKVIIKTNAKTTLPIGTIFPGSHSS